MTGYTRKRGATKQVLRKRAASSQGSNRRLRQPSPSSGQSQQQQQPQQQPQQPFGG